MGMFKPDCKTVFIMLVIGLTYCPALLQTGKAWNEYLQVDPKYTTKMGIWTCA